MILDQHLPSVQIYQVSRMLFQILHQGTGPHDNIALLELPGLLEPYRDVINLNERAPKEVYYLNSVEFMETELETHVRL